jgi:glycosyltransferase involved in cell wall biosynthesis
VDDIEPFYHAIDVFVSTSEYETFGNSVCEAMACARPVAGYVGGSVGEVVGEAGITVPDKDVDALVRAVVTLVDDEVYRRSLGAAARARVARDFDPRRTFEQLGDLYQKLLAASTATGEIPRV